MSHVARLPSSARAAFPRGDSLPQSSWDRRHFGLVGLLWAHLLFIPWFGTAQGHGLAHSLMETALVAMFAVGATVRTFNRAGRAVIATMGLASCSAILVHLSGGVIEMHFHFFVVVALVTLYQSWLPFGVAIAYVVLHHGIAGALDPSSVYNHPAAIAQPWKWALIHGTFIMGESVACVIAWRLNEDALGRERSTRVELEQANKDLVEAQELSLIGSWEWDVAADKLWWSDQMYKICGLDPAEFGPTYESYLTLVHEDDRHKVAATVEGIFAGDSRIDLEYRIVRPTGVERVVHALGEATHAADGSVLRMLGTVQDITERKLLEQEVEHKAFHDALTGLANRALFLNRVDHALALRERSEDEISLVFLDLDDFKTVNDTLGHGAGDELLVEVATRIRAILRPSDTVARLGGDEFAVLLERADSQGAIKVAGRIHEALQAPISLQGKEVFVHASIGIAIASRGISAEELLRDADIAMYEVKKQGKNGHKVFEPEMRSSLVRGLELKAELQSALDNGDFVLHYQPIVELDSGEITGLEALVRWNHRTEGVIPPNDFIPLAEGTGLIVELGAWVLREATSRTKGLQEVLGRPLWVSVNLSVRQLQQGDLVEVVERALLESRLDPSDLILELTESGLVGDKQAHIAKLRDLRALGVKIAIDDFGTGYSSLSYLHQLPIDILKIDRAFVAAATEGPEEAALAQAVVRLASILKLRAIAEGVETPEQRDRLMSFGCELGQGFLFCRPVEPAELEKRLSLVLEHSG